MRSAQANERLFLTGAPIIKMPAERPHLPSSHSCLQNPWARFGIKGELASQLDLPAQTDFGPEAIILPRNSRP